MFHFLSDLPGLQVAPRCTMGRPNVPNATFYPGATKATLWGLAAHFRSFSFLLLLHSSDLLSISVSSHVPRPVSQHAYPSSKSFTMSSEPNIAYCVIPILILIPIPTVQVMSS